MSEKILYDSIENWKGGKSEAYYEPFSNEIHILKGKDHEFRALIHEKIHASRKSKLTFKLATLIQLELLRDVLFGLFVLTGVIGLATLDLIPFGFMAAFFLVCLACSMLEEWKADSATLKSMHEIKRGHNDGVV